MPEMKINIGVNGQRAKQLSQRYNDAPVAQMIYYVGKVAIQTFVGCITAMKA